MWLPTPIYESLPIALMLFGGLLALSGYLPRAQWLQSTLLIGGSLFGVAGLVLMLKRRDYRLSRSRVKYDKLD